MANGITLSTLTAEATYESIAVELKYTGDDNDSATALLEFRVTGSGSAYRKATGDGTSNMWRVAKLVSGAALPDSATRGLYAKILFLEPATTYDVRVTVTDADGVTGTNPVSTTCTTRTDAITAPDSITATTTLHVNSVTGNDTTGTGAAGAPYKSLARAVTVANAGSGSHLILLRANGGATTYYRPGGTLTKSDTTIKAENVAVDASCTVVNAGARIVIEPGPTTTGAVAPYVVGPTGATDADLTAIGGWTLEDIAGHDSTGAATGRTYKIWKSPALAVNGPRQIFYGATRDAMPTRIPWWKVTTNAALPTDTVNKWAESMVHVSQTSDQGYQYGSWGDGAGRLYVRIYDASKPSAADANDANNSGLNPNSYYVKYSPTAIQAITLNGADQRVCGIETHGSYASVVLGAASARAIVDRCYLLTGWYAIRCTGTSGLPSVYATDATIQENRFINSALWDETRHRGIANWMWIKQSSKWGGENECFSISFSSGPRRSVVRRNYSSGDFDFINCNPTSLTNFDRYANYGMDCHDNIVDGYSDDFADMGKQAINVAFWGNRASRGPVFLSTGAGWAGPLYVVRNVGWRLGAEGVGLAPSGASNVANGKAFKYSQGSDPNQRVYVVHNTFWGDSTYLSGVTGGGEMTAGGGGTSESYWLKNNVFRGTRHAYHVAQAGHFAVEDYNAFQTTQFAATMRGIDYPVSGSPFTTIAGYRTASGKGANSNKSGGVDFDIRDQDGSLAIDAALADPTIGNLLLGESSGLIGAGTPVDNVSDVEYTSGDIKPYHRSGAAPDIGAYEDGLAEVAGTAPDAPSGLGATAISATRIDLAWTDASDDELGFRVERAPDDGGAAGTYAEIGTTGASVATYADTGLAVNTRYWYRVRAYNAAGTSAYAAADDATTLEATPAPTAPSGLVATAISASAIRLVWVDNADNETGFEVERSPNGSTGWAQIATPAAEITAHNDTGLTDETTYHYRVRAVNGAGNSAYTSVAFATTEAIPVSAPGTSAVGRSSAVGRFSRAA